MAQRMIERACDRFRKELTPDDARIIETTANLDDVKLAICQVEQTLAARQELRNVARITPFINTLERYSRALDVLANGTPYLPYIWAPLKVMLQAAQDYTHALDKILSAYGSIGLEMPRFSRYAEAFPDDRAFQHLVAFLFEDVMEFHRQAYALVRKSGWKIFFKSAWGGFDLRFTDLLDSISRISDQIDREAMAIDIVQAAEQRRKDAEESNQRGTRLRAQQLNAVLNWLEASDTDQEMKFEWLTSRCYEGTLDWTLQSPKLRAWLQRGRGKQVLWLHGKPGSGKSILAARLISFLRTDPSRRVCYFFCDFNTPTLAASGHIFKVIAAQLLRMSPDFAPYLYEECIARAQRASSGVLQKLLPPLMAQIDDVRLVVDGINEISASEHRKLISDLLRLTKTVRACKLLLISQDIPTISVQLAKQARLSMADEKENVQKDLAAIVKGSLEDLNSHHSGALGETVLEDLQSRILQKAEGRETLGDETKPLPNSTDICKPLIEDGPGGSLVFVHSTVPQFLGEHGDATFINGLESRASIAYACLCQLYQGLGFLEDSSTSTSAAGIASGLFALWSYSYEHWTEHLLDCFKTEHEPMPESIQAVAIQDMRFSNLGSVTDPSIMRLISGLHTAPRQSSEDEGPLARAMRAHQDIVEALIREDDVPGVSQESLFTFKEVYGPIAFVCSIRGCPMTAKCLQAHKRKHHGAAALKPVPKRLRRVGRLSGNMGDDHIRDEDEWECIPNPQARYKLQVNLCRVIPERSALDSVCFSPDGTKIAVCGIGFASVFETSTGMLLQELEHNLDQDEIDVRSVCFSPDGKRLITGGDDGLITIWDIESRSVNQTLLGHENAIDSIDFARDGHTIVSGSSRVTCVAISPDSKYVAACSFSLKIYALDIEDRNRLVATLEGPNYHENSILGVTFSPDGKKIVTGDINGMINIWELGDPLCCLKTLKGHESTVRSVTFTPDGYWIVSGSRDKEVRFWDAKTGESQLSLTGHKDIVKSVVASPVSNYIATASWDKTIRIWSYREV
ncbi:hypothetical protein ACJZ2D_005849 [Fusarium nematophilum]